MPTPHTETGFMRDRMLHESLRSLTFDASYLLTDLLATGEEIPFEVGESSGADKSSAKNGQSARATMFAYRPMTGEFVSSHADQLRALPTFENAAQSLARTRGMIAYLRVRDEPILDVGELTHARLAALAFLSAVWNDAEQFDEWGDRFERAYHELESVALAERLVTTVFVPVFGVTLNCETVNLGAGVELMAPEDLDETCANRFSDSVIGADSYCAISLDAPSDAPAPMPEIRHSARSLLTALRMFKPGSVSLGLTAQADVGGAWQQVSLPFTGRSREDAWALQPGEDEELRQFISAVRRVERRTRVSWALKRFEMGLERTVPAEGLTDFLGALRALLEANDDTGKAALPARVSALCARDSERVHVRAAVEAAFALERLAVDGMISRADRKRLAKQPPLEVIADTERYLRALLHDLVCGYLASDLKKLADEILMADGEPTGPETAQHEPVYLEPVPDPGAPPAPDPTETVEFEAVFDDTAEISAIDTREEEEPRGNVWMLRPAAEITPAPEVSSNDAQIGDETPEFVPEPPVQFVEPGPEMTEKAEELVETFDTAFGETMEDADAFGPDLVPEWEARPERKEPGTEFAAAHPDADSGFTFNFQKLAPAEPPVAPTKAKVRGADPLPEPIAGAAQDPDFPIPEFGLRIGPGQAAQNSDLVVDGGTQRENFNEIMDENFTPPERDLNERPTTPVARDGKPHLVGLENPSEPKPRIVHPDIFASRGPSQIRRIEPKNEPPVTADFDEPMDVSPRLELAPQPAPRLKPLPTPEPEPEPEPVNHAPPSSEEARTHKIGPPTIEFRPVIDPDTDDPDDFAGAV
jgi:hypothetical protein